MNRSFSVIVVMAGVSALMAGSVRGDDKKDATPIIDAAIKALGGEEKLAKATTVSVKTEGTVTINDNETPIKVSTTTQGLDRQRSEFELEFNGEPFKGMAVVNVDKGWRKFGDNLMEMEDQEVAAAKQGAYLVAVASTVLPLKGKGFKTEVAAEEKVDGKPADVVKATGPDGKPFTVYFDKETHLPIRLVATVKGMQGEDFVQDTSYSDFKDFNGIKRSTKHESKRDGNPFSKQKLVSFKVVEKPEAKLFEEPK